MERKVTGVTAKEGRSQLYLFFLNCFFPGKYIIKLLNVLKNPSNEKALEENQFLVKLLLPLVVTHKESQVDIA